MFRAEQGPPKEDQPGLEREEPDAQMCGPWHIRELLEGEERGPRRLRGAGESPRCCGGADGRGSQLGPHPTMRRGRPSSVSWLVRGGRLMKAGLAQQRAASACEARSPALS
eukprot:8899338-Pyramimonas_sp.AAC.1